MRISTSNAVQEIDSILRDVTERGGRVELCENDKVVAIIHPVEPRREDSLETVSEDAYKTWGETLAS